MIKSEFIDRLETEAKEQKYPQIYSDMVAAVREVLEQYPDSLDIETNKGIKDLYSAMEKYAREHKEGSCGYCPPSEARRIIIEIYDLKESEAPASAADIDILDLF